MDHYFGWRGMPGWWKSASGIQCIKKGAYGRLPRPHCLIIISWQLSPPVSLPIQAFVFIGKNLFPETGY